MRNLGFQLCILIFLCCFNFPIGCFDKLTALFVFGDSMYDPGNNNYLNSLSAYRSNFKPYGESYFKHPTGRFSDGRLIPDFIGKPIHSNCFYNFLFCFLTLVLSSGISGICKVADDSIILPSSSQPFYLRGELCLCWCWLSRSNLQWKAWKLNLQVMSLNTQLGNFKIVREKLKAEVISERSLSDAVYLFSIANNDYLRLFDIPDTPSDISCLAYATEKEYMDMVMDNFVTVIMEIYKLGGRKFGIQNLLPLGCLPRFRGIAFLREGHHGDYCLDELNSIVKKHNFALLQKLKQLKKELRGLEYSYFSIFDALNELFDNPSTYGFTEAKSGCCGLGRYRGFGICGKAKAYELCKNVKEHVIFDSYHPTEKASHHFARVWWQGDPNVVESQSLKSLFLPAS